MFSCSLTSLDKDAIRLAVLKASSLTLLLEVNLFTRPAKAASVDCTFSHNQNSLVFYNVIVIYKIVIQ